MTTLRSFVSLVIELSLKVILIESEGSAARDDPHDCNDNEHDINPIALDFKWLTRFCTCNTRIIVLGNWHDNKQRSLSN